MDRPAIRRYKTWLSRYVDLHDCAYSTGGHWSQFTDFELEQFRQSSEPFLEKYVDGYRFPFKVYRTRQIPNYGKLGSHFDKDDDFTIFVSNRSSPVLLCLMDVDNKDGSGDVQRATEHLIKSYGLSSVYVEPSTYYLGRHVYFLLDTTVTGVRFGLDRSDIRKTFERFTSIVQTDAIWKETGVTFDGVYGFPTCWIQEAGELRVKERGNALKLPRCLSGLADLEKLEALSPLSLERLQNALKSSNFVAALPKTALGGSSDIPQVQTGSEAVANSPIFVAALPKTALGGSSDISRLNGIEKKRQCIGALLRANDGVVSFEEVLADYLVNWNPTTEGDTPKKIETRERKLRDCLRTMGKRFKPKKDQRLYPFQRDQFLPVVEALALPAELWTWKSSNRGTINPRKLSDFLCLMIANAFYKDGDFAQTKRDTSINNFRTLRVNGLVDWTLTTNVYTKLLSISVQYELLEVVEDFKTPIRDPHTKRKLADGHARTIGPGKALPDVRNRWRPLYNASKATETGRRATGRLAG